MLSLLKLRRQELIAGHAGPAQQLFLNQGSARRAAWSIQQIHLGESNHILEASTKYVQGALAWIRQLHGLDCLSRSGEMCIQNKIKSAGQNKQIDHAYQHIYLQQPQLQCLQIHRHVGSNVQTHPCKLRLPTYSDTLRYQESFTVIQSHSIILCQASSAQHSGKGLKKHFQNCCRICWGISKET